MENDLVSPYIESHRSSSDTLFSNEGAPSVNVKKSESTMQYFQIDGISMVLYIVVTILLLYIIYTSYFGQSDFFSSTEREDQDNYLDRQIERLNKMQDENLL